MTTALTTRALTWTPWGSQATLSAVDFAVDRGERVLVTGGSGSGKSTLLRAIAGVLVDYQPGDLTGEISVPDARPGAVGLLTQNPVDQVVAGSVGRDVAFGPENIGVTGPTLRSRVADLLAGVRLADLGVDRRSTHVSGGQGQRVGLAGLLGLAPRVMLLDEPLSMLDPGSAAVVRDAILDAAATSDAALIVVDHDLETWWPHVDRVVVLSHGAVVFDGAPADAGAHLTSPELWLPGRERPVPQEIAWRHEDPPSGDAPFLRADGLAVTSRGGELLDRTDAAILGGRALAVTGPSGAGKTTLLRLFAGWARPTGGALRASPALADGIVAEPWRWRSRDAARRIAFVGQNPAVGMIAQHVLDEVLTTRRLVGRAGQDDGDRARALLDSIGLGGAAHRSVHTLSGGEQRRLALATAIAGDAPVVLLDEPTVGQDRMSWAAVAGALRSLTAAGRAVALSTHDRRIIAEVDDEHVVGGAHAAGGRR